MTDDRDARRREQEAERARRYRARQRGEDEPLRKPGPAKQPARRQADLVRENLQLHGTIRLLEQENKALREQLQRARQQHDRRARTEAVDLDAITNANAGP